MIWFAIASLTPYVLATVASAGVGWMPYLCFYYMALGVAGLDVLIPNKPDSFKASTTGSTLSVILAVVHLCLFPIGVYAIAGETGLQPLEQFTLLVCIGMIFGQVSNSFAHELIHKNSRPLRFLGKLVYSSLLFGHQTTAHPALHHRYVATDQDPNSAARGQTLYGFIPKAWIGSYIGGLRVENTRLALSGRSPWSWKNPYWDYGFWGVVSVAVSFLVAGWMGVLIHIAVASFGTMQLLTSDYVQHYGLRRAELGEGRYEHVGPQHSWNAPKSMSRLMMLNAPLHSEHHMRPTKPYVSLNEASAPMGPVLPYSLPVMVTIALMPRLWRKVMNRELNRIAAEAKAKAAQGQDPKSYPTAAE